ncbi:MAG TPA: hypothetical protein ENK45_01965 [Aliiroseovarius sp.]|nr:hypothetical protein [Aliiroseovarius sp.]
MSEIAELEGRITAALDRIGQGLDALGPKADPAVAQAAAQETARLRAALEEEKKTNAQLEERVRAIKEKQEFTVTRLTEEVERLRSILERGESDTQGMLRAMSQLRDNNAALRDAVRRGLAEPHLVNKSMMAELEALRAMRAADRTELDAVLAEFAPLVTPLFDGAREEGENA